MEEITTDLNNITQLVNNLETYYKAEGGSAVSLNSALSQDKPLQQELLKIRIDLNDMYGTAMYTVSEEQRKINEKNTAFEENKFELDTLLEDYISKKDKTNSSSVYKLDIYDRNIEDNLFLIYYFLSYGILGLFIYKLLK
jgi:hemerythrin-like domain-containing protein